MVSARVAVLLALVVPVDARAATDEPEVTVDESSASQPTLEPVPPMPPPPAARSEPAPVPRTPPPTAHAVERLGVAGLGASAAVQPGTSVGLEFGYAQGGDRLVTLYFFEPRLDGSEAGINAGDGVFVSLTGSWTPLWRDNFALGLYASAGIKYAEASEPYGSVSFTRYPLAAAAQVLVPAWEKWFVVGRMGPLAEVGAKLSGDGTFARINTDFATKLGGFADVGLQRAIGQYVAVAVVVRYTYLDVSLGGATTSANNLGVGLAFCFFR